MERNETENTFTPRIVDCLDCGQPFVLTPGERQFYLDKSLSEPKRCPQCRKFRRLCQPEVRK